MQPMIDVPTHLVPYAYRTAAGTDDIFYYAAGRPEAPVLLLIHGMADDADTWRHVLLPLSRFFRVIAPDLPGFGRSRASTTAPSITAYARLLHRFLRGLGVERCSLVGHSFGAMIAQRMSMVAGAAISRQVLIGGTLPLQAGRPAAIPWPALVPGLGALAIRALRRSPSAAFRSLEPYFADLDGLPAADRRFLEKRVWARVQNSGLTRHLMRALRWLVLDSLLRPTEFRLQVLTNRVPTALIFGERDRVVDPRSAAQLVSARPDVALHTLADCGHTPQVEMPEAVSTVIVDHLAPRPMTLLRRRAEEKPPRR